MKNSYSTDVRLAWKFQLSRRNELCARKQRISSGRSKMLRNPMIPATRSSVPGGWGHRARNAVAVPQRSITK